MTTSDGQGADRLTAAVQVLMGDVDRHEDALCAQSEEVAAVRAAINAAAQTAAQANTAATQLASGVAALADQVRALRRQAAADRPNLDPAWLTVDDSKTAQVMLTNLVEWLAVVYLRYPDAVPLGDCWAWHPSAVAELLACRAVWYDAYEGENTSAAKQMDWHDRWRPGTVRRVGGELRSCQIEAHAPNGKLEYRRIDVPGIGQVGELAQWWAQTHGTTAAPPASPETIAIANAARKATYDRRR